MIKMVKSFDKTLIAYDYKKNKSDTVLIFLHGAGANLHAWDKEVEFFNKQHISTIAVDLRGHGSSQRPKNESDYELNNFAKDIKAIIDKEKIKDLILVGHCFGGMITIKFSSIYPKLSKSYTLIDTTYKYPKKLHELFAKHPLITKLINYKLDTVKISKNYKGSTNYNNFLGTGDLNFDRILTDIQNTTLKSWVFVYENIAKFDGKNALENIKKPTLIIEGNNDLIFNTSIAKEIHSLVKNSKYDDIQNASHVIVMNDPKEVSDAIYKFISKNNLININKN